MGHLYSSTLRVAAIPFALPLLGQEQHGARPHGGTEFPVMIRRFSLEWATCLGISATVLYCDLRKAFYSVVPEAVLGPLLCPHERAALLLAVGFATQQYNFQ